MKMIKKLLIALSIVVIVCCLVVVLLPRMNYTAVLDIDRLDFEPEHYFELTEENLDKYPILRKALEEMKKEEKRKILEIIPEEKGVIVYEYLRLRQGEVGPVGLSPPADACFKCRGDLYAFRVHKPLHDFDFVIDIERLYEPEHYFELTEENLDKYPILRKALEGMKRQEEATILYEVPKDEGYAIYSYLTQKQSELGPTDTYYPYIACFKYGGALYGFNLMT